MTVLLGEAHMQMDKKDPFMMCKNRRGCIRSEGWISALFGDLCIDGQLLYKLPSLSVKEQICYDVWSHFMSVDGTNYC